MLISSKRKNILIAVLAALAVISLFCMSGCKLQRGSQKESSQNNSADALKLLECNFDLSDISDIYLGRTLDDALPYNIAKNEKNTQIQVDGYELIVSPMEDGEYNAVSFKYYNHNENVGPSYESILYQEEAGLYESFSTYLNDGLEYYFPKKDLEECSIDEAVKFCSSYAKVLGYDASADVSVYSLSVDSLTSASTYTGKWSGSGFEGDGEIYISAPNPDAPLVYREADMDDMEKTAWSKQDEAYLIIYRPAYDGKIIDCSNQQLHLVYVPSRNEIVYASGCIAYQYDYAKKEDIITKESALEKVMLADGISDEADVNVLSDSLVYSANYEQFVNDGKLYPYYRITYQKKDKDIETTHMVDAVTGYMFTN